jgi:hypothetical protein
MNIYRTGLLLVVATLLASPSAALGITLGQVDTFENGAVAGWAVVNPTLQINGPAGSADHYVQVSSGASGQQSNLQMFNQSQWLGNYLAAGVTGVEMDLKNLNFTGADSIRIAIREGTASSITSGYSSTIAFNLPVDGQWHHAIFSLAAGSLTGINSPQPLASDLANVVNFGILSSVSPSTMGDPITLGSLGVDNIHALPEPSSISILLSGIVGIALLRRRRIQR